MVVVSKHKKTALQPSAIAGKLLNKTDRPVTCFWVREMRSREIMVALEKLFKRLDTIDAKLSVMPQVRLQVSSRFLPTINALISLGSATATEVSKVTGRSRAFESKNLNELYAMGLISKHGEGRFKIFTYKKTENYDQEKVISQP
jgi:predicted transcriptional regulator